MRPGCPGVDWFVNGLIVEFMLGPGKRSVGVKCLQDVVDVVDFRPKDYGKVLKTIVRAAKNRAAVVDFIPKKDGLGFKQ